MRTTMTRTSAATSWPYDRASDVHVLDARGDKPSLILNAVRVMTVAMGDRSTIEGDAMPLRRASAWANSTRSTIDIGII
jgi:hypothetical protein